MGGVTADLQDITCLALFLGREKLLTYQLGICFFLLSVVSNNFRKLVLVSAEISTVQLRVETNCLDLQA